MNKTAQAEEVQHTLYLDIRRNWKQEVNEPFYASKVFFMKDGRIGMEYGGRVIVRTIEHWMSSAVVRAMPEPESELYFE